jgi:hypothetical protein
MQVLLLAFIYLSAMFSNTKDPSVYEEESEGVGAKNCGRRAEEHQGVLGGSKEGGPRQTAMETCSRGPMLRSDR